MREKQWAEKYPEFEMGPVPAEPCVSEAYLSLERDRIFRRTWINVGRVEDVPKIGDYLVCDLAVCKASILVIRGSDGIVRGCHNVCSHRSRKLLPTEQGSCAGRVYCPFHGWVYSDTGELIRIPDERHFFDFDRRDHGLAPVNTDIWEGFIVVNLSDTPQTLREYLGGVAEQLDGCPFHEMKRSFTYKIEVNANWKVVQDGQNETYLWSVEYQATQKLTPMRIALAADAFKTKLFHVAQMIGKMDHYVVFPNFCDPPRADRPVHNLPHLQLMAAVRRSDDLGDSHALHGASDSVRAAPARVFQAPHLGHPPRGHGRA